MQITVVDKQDYFNPKIYQIEVNENVTVKDLLESGVLKHEHPEWFYQDRAKELLEFKPYIAGSGACCFIVWQSSIEWYPYAYVQPVNHNKL